MTEFPQILKAPETCGGCLFCSNKTDGYCIHPMFQSPFSYPCPTVGVCEECPLVEIEKAAREWGESERKDGYRHRNYQAHREKETGEPCELHYIGGEL